MKIICFIRPDPPLVYFANRIHEKHRIAFVVLERYKRASSVLSRIKAHGLSGSINVLRKRLASRSTYVRTYDRFLKGSWRALNSEIPCLEVDCINSEKVYDRLRHERPDLVLDHGTSIVEDRILETSRCALNLHWGLSPYYRGTHCTEWALINWDPYNIGVTVHTLTKRIDGGHILAQERATVQPHDSVHSINMQLTHLGTDLVVKALDKIAAGEKLSFHTQDYSLGHLTLLRQWNRHMDGAIEFIERNGLIGSMLSNPSRRERLPIVTA